MCISGLIVKMKAEISRLTTWWAQIFFEVDSSLGLRFDQAQQTNTRREKLIEALLETIKIIERNAFEGGRNH